MEVKPGYKHTEVGVIPEDWTLGELAQLCVKIQDGTHFSPKIRGNDFLYITSKNIRFGYLDISTADRIDAAQHAAIYKRCDVKRGDLLLTKDGANTGNAAINTLTEQFSLLSSVAFLRFDHKQHSAAYFLQQCLSVAGQQRMKDAMSGNAITRLTLEKIRKLRFPIPPLPEQQAIANALNDADALIESLEQLIEKKRQIKQGVMQILLTGKVRLV
jgi:type I restriction enzyme S subunit